MAEARDFNLHSLRLPREPQQTADLSMHPAWLRLIRYCAELGHGEIEKLKIQDGLPMAAEVATKKIKFSP
jgi:hypothetical protein